MGTRENPLNPINGCSSLKIRYPIAIRAPAELWLRILLEPNAHRFGSIGLGYLGNFSSLYDEIPRPVSRVPKEGYAGAGLEKHKHAAKPIGAGRSFFEATPCLIGFEKGKPVFGRPPQPKKEREREATPAKASGEHNARTELSPFPPPRKKKQWTEFNAGPQTKKGCTRLPLLRHIPHRSLYVLAVMHQTCQLVQLIYARAAKTDEDLPLLAVCDTPYSPKKRP